jgi:hypothetical protein
MGGLSETNTASAQVASKERVEARGEVLTGPREVNAMLALVQQETERIESRFLEPACGTGNFLAPILQRKLAIVEKKYRRSQPEYERYAVLAVSSIYGIDIQSDNVERCRDRLFAIFDYEYSRVFKAKAKDKCRDSVRFILERNIAVGNALTLKTEGEDPEPIVFSEWAPFNHVFLKRRDFTFRDLLTPESTQALPLVSDRGEHVFFPEPIRDFQPIHFLEISRVRYD